MMAPNRVSVLRLLSLITIIALSDTLVAAHEHHDEELPPGQVITFDPVDGILWTHIFFMSMAFGVLFPTGMVSSSLEFLFTV
jgi:hypothetical protein